MLGLTDARIECRDPLATANGSVGRVADTRVERRSSSLRLKICTTESQLRKLVEIVNLKSDGIRAGAFDSVNHSCHVTVRQ